MLEPIVIDMENRISKLSSSSSLKGNVKGALKGCREKVPDSYSYFKPAVELSKVTFETMTRRRNESELGGGLVP